jgi:uncharacterized protein YbcV (DUF1398 family)
MEKSVKQVIEQCGRDSYAGTAGFAAIVAALLEAGVESYSADYRAGKTIYYMPTGEVLFMPLTTPDTEIPQVFDAAALVRAIRGAQRGEIKYPQFINLSMAAGCAGYIVWLTGKHVSYFGRQGEVHIEPFPASA